MRRIRRYILLAFILSLCLSFPAFAEEAATAERAAVDQQIIALLGDDGEGGRVFTLDAWELYCKEYHGIEWDGSYLNERNKYTLENGEELVKPFLEKYDIVTRSVEEQQAEWEAFHRQYWGGRPMRMARAAIPNSVTFPCERCGTSITVYEGDWTRSCYSCTCIETNCKRPGIFKDDDFAGYDCRYHNHDSSTRNAARYCQWPYISQHVKLPGLWEDNGSPYADWEENYCPEHACKNALASGKGCTGKSADGIDYCVACDGLYGDSEPPTGVTATPEGGWLRRNNTVTFSATDKSTPIEYRVLNSSGAVVRDWSTAATASLGNGTYSLYARDAKGNVSAAKSFTVNNVDTSAPNKPALSKSPAATWSKTNVTVTIAHGSDNGVSGVARTEYSTNGGTSWATYSSALTISSTTTVYARTVDRAGNTSANASIQVNIDKTAPAAPKLAKSPNVNWTNGNTTVTITAGADTGGSGVARTEYSTNGGSTWATYSSALTISSTTTVYARTVDRAGNTSANASIQVNIDKTAPAAPKLAKSPNVNWTNGNTAVTITAGADTGGSGVARTEYSTNGGTSWTTYSSALTISSTTTVYARTVDNAGNTSANASIQVNIDKTKPAAPKLAKSPNVTWANSNTTVTITAGADTGGSGVARTEYSTNNSTWSAYSAALTITSSQTVYARTIDNAGNTSATAQLAVNIDRTRPNAPASVTKSPAANWHNGNVTVTAAPGTDTGGSGIARTEYSTDNSTWQTYSAPVSVASSQTVYARMVDNAGNISTVKSIAVNIDRDKPSMPQLAKSPAAEWHNGDVTVSVTGGSDTGGSGVSRTEYSTNGTNWTAYTSAITVASTQTVYARTWDVAGNVSDTATLKVQIDRVKPVAPVLAKTPAAEWANGDVTVSITHGTDTASGPARTEYSFDNQSWQVYDIPLTIREDTEIFARTWDKAGNLSPVSSVEVKIDRQKPADPSIFKSPNVEWSKNDVTVTVAGGTDAISGVLRTEYSFDGETWRTYTSPLTVSETTAVYARTLDKALNASGVVRLQVNVDKTAPPVPSLSKSPAGAWHNGDVIVTIRQGADIGGSGNVLTEYSLDGKSWLAYTEALTLEETATVYARATDAAGNISSTGSIEVKIDREAPAAPRLQKSPDTEWHHDDVSVTVLDGSDKGGSEAARSEYSFDNKSWLTVSGPVTADTSCTVYARTLDNAGNISDVSSAEIKIDRSEPGSPVIRKNPSAEWSNGSVRVTIEDAPETASGTVRTEYSFNGEGWKPYTDPLLIKENGTLRVRTLNEAGSYSPVVTEQIRIDTGKPSAPSFRKTPAADWHNGDVVLAILDGEDALSGVARTEYTVDGEIWQPYTGPLTFKESADVQARTIDRAGNISDAASAAVKVDREAPELPVITKVPGTEWAQGNVRVTIAHGADADSGPEKTEYCFDGKSWVQYTGPLTVTETKTVYARTTDKAGNVSDVAQEAIKIDSVPPTVPTITKSPDVAWADEPVVVTITPGTDGNSGVQGAEYSFDRITWYPYVEPVEVDRPVVVYARTIDEAGNRSATISVDVNVDITAPDVPEIIKNPATDWSNGSVTVSVRAPEDTGSGLRSVEIKIGGGDWEPYEKPVIVKETTTVYVRATDNVGNVSETGQCEVGIDNTPPVLESVVVHETKDGKTVEVKASDKGGSGVREIQINGKSYPGDTAIYIPGEKEKTIRVQVFDDAGNASDMETRDIMPPVIRSVTVNENCTEVEILAADQGGSGLKGIWVGGELHRDNPLAYTIPEGTESVFIQAEDNDGNRSPAKEYDVCPPEITAVKLSADYTQALITAADKGPAGVKGIYVSANGKVQFFPGSSITYDIPVRTRTILVWAEDNDGNAGKDGAKSYDVANPDQVPPAITGLTIGASYSNVTVTASDEGGSGMKGIHINDVLYLGDEVDYDLLEHGAKRVKAQAEDKAGNLSETVERDVCRPVITDISISRTFDEVVVTAADEGGSGLAGIYLDGGFTAGDTASYRFTIGASGQAIETYALDGDGNKSETVRIDLSRTDTTPPVIERAFFSADGKTLIVQASDGDSGIKGITINGKFLPGSLVLYDVPEGERYLEIFATDYQLNDSDVVIRELPEPDESAPRILSVTFSEDGKSVTVQAEDDGSGIKGIEINGVLIAGDEVTYPLNGTEDKLVIVAVDNAGNRSEPVIKDVPVIGGGDTGDGGNTGSGDNGNTGSGDNGNTGSGDNGNTGSGDNGNTGSGDNGNTGSGDNGNTGSGDNGNTGSGDNGNTGSGDNGNTGSGDNGNTGSGDNGNTGSGDNGNTGSGDNGNTGSGDGDGSGSDSSIGTTIKIKITAPRGWKTRNARVMISAEDEQYGIQLLEARVAGGGWEDITDTGFLTITQNTRIYVRATNGLGQELKKSKAISCFDNEAPTLAVRQNGKAARIMAQDELSGVSHLLINGEKFDVTDTAWNVNDVVVDYELPAGLKTLSVYAVDNAGNRSAQAKLTVDGSLLGDGSNDGNPGSNPGGNNPGGGNPDGGSNGGNTGSRPTGGTPDGDSNGGLPGTGNPGGDGSNGNPDSGNPGGGQQNPGQPSSFQKQPEGGNEDNGENEDGVPSSEDGKVKYIVIGGEDGQPQKLYETTYYLPSIKIPVMDGMEADEIYALVEAALKSAMPANTSGSGGCGEHCICCQCVQQHCGLDEQDATVETRAVHTTDTESPSTHWQTVLLVILIILAVVLLLYWIFHNFGHFGYEE